MTEKRIIYILGAGRSGTTLLDVMLGNGKDAFSMGEVIRFPELKGNPHGFEKGTEHYKFWKEVEQEMIKKDPEYKDHEKFFTLSRTTEFHRNFFKYILWTPSGSVKNIYRNYWDTFFEIVFNKSEKKILIDSSKYPLRALALNKYSSHKIDFIYLIREPSDVVRSFAKKEIEQPSKGFISANLYYFAINLLSRFVLSRLKDTRVVTIRYNDLVNDPSLALKNISSKLDIDLSNSIDLINGSKDLKTGYMFEGNRIRLSPTLKVKISHEKERSFSLKDMISRTLNFWFWNASK